MFYKSVHQILLVSLDIIYIHFIYLFCYNTIFCAFIFYNILATHLKNLPIVYISLYILYICLNFLSISQYIRSIHTVRLSITLYR